MLCYIQLRTQVASPVMNRSNSRPDCFSQKLIRFNSLPIAQAASENIDSGQLVTQAENHSFRINSWINPMPCWDTVCWHVAVWPELWHSPKLTWMTCISDMNFLFFSKFSSIARAMMFPMTAGRSQLPALQQQQAASSAAYQDAHSRHSKRITT